MSCPVCRTPDEAPLYERLDAPSISSYALIIAAPTRVFGCRSCAHVYTQPLEDIDRYYDTGYNVRLEAHAADDLYDVRDGAPYYRAQHQAAVALAKLDLPPGARVLDFGSGKAATLRAMLGERGDLKPFVFDVSTNYKALWDEFVPEAHQASYALPDRWSGTLDAVLSFFALEHVSDPRGFLATVRDLLAPAGRLHAIVPNVRRNIGDFVVVDHVNHFMPTSLRFALEAEGFTDITIDESVHTAAFVVNARKADATTVPCATSDVATYVAEAAAFAARWRAADAHVHAFEDAHRGKPAAVYGSGFYGVFIASTLRDRSALTAFIDQNPHQQAKRIFDLPVVPPDRLSDDVEVVYAGLNPARAESIIASVESIARRPRAVFYLE